MKLQGNLLKRNSMRFAAALLAALASFVAGPNAALAAAPQHHDQAPGFYRLKVGDLEVTALYDGTGVFDPHWLNGTKATMDGVVKGLHEDPHMLDVVDTGFLVNTGKQLILVDAGAGAWWGGGVLGRLAGSLRSAGYTPEEVDLVLVTHLHSDHVGGLTTQDGKRVFPNADVYVAKAESDFWLSPDIAAKAPKDAQPFFQSAQAIAAPYIKAGKWHTFSGSEKIVDGMELVPLPGHTLGMTGYEFSSRGQKVLFLGDIVHALRVQIKHPEVTTVFDIDPTAAAATRNQLLPRLAGETAALRHLEAWERGNSWWLAIGVLLEVLSFAGYVLLFRAVFVRGTGVIGWRESYQISLAGLNGGASRSHHPALCTAVGADRNRSTSVPSSSTRITSSDAPSSASSAASTMYAPERVSRPQIGSVVILTARLHAARSGVKFHVGEHVQLSGYTKG